MRLFFALWPPPEAARALGEWAREVQARSGGRATRDETIHLTLAFLGDGDVSKASAAGRAVRARAFEFPLEQARYWPHNHVVWIGPRETPPALADLVGQLHPALSQAGFQLEKRPFAAHVTLVRKAGRLDSIPRLPLVQWPVSEFLLLRSKVSGAGAQYEPLERFSLQAKS